MANPTFDTLKSSVATDIRDPNFAVFTEPVIGDFVNQGMSEVGRVYPLEVVDDVTPVADQYEYTIEPKTAFRVDWYRNNRFWKTIEPNEDVSSQGGWELFAGKLRIPEGILNQASPDTDFLRVWGYRGRARLLTDGQVAELDDDAEWALRAFARWRAFDAMGSERSLFKQWQAMSGNTDVSWNQLLTSVNLYFGEWKRQRDRLRLLRRV